MKKARNSNLELLRLFAMFSIVFFHQLGIPFVVEAANPAGTAFELVSPHWLLYGVIRMFHAYGYFVGNILFAMISGYFLIHKTVTWNKIGNTVIKFFGILLFNFFASILLNGVLRASLGAQTINNSFFENIWTDLFSISSYWYLGSYLFLLAFTPWLNKFLNKLDAKNYLGLVIAVIAILGLLNLNNNFLIPDFRISQVIAGFLIGTFLGKYNFLQKIKSRYIWLVGIIVPVFYYLGAFSSNFILGHKTLLDSASDSGNMFDSRLAIGYLVYLLSIGIFELFRRVKIQRGLVNYLATTTLFIYVFHLSNMPAQSILGKVLLNDVPRHLEINSSIVFNFVYLLLLLLNGFVIFLVSMIFGVILNAVTPIFKRVFGKMLPFSFDEINS